MMLTNFSVQGHKWVSVLIRSVLQALTISAYRMYIGTCKNSSGTYKRHLFLPSSGTVDRLQVILQIFIMEISFGTVGAFLIPHQVIIIRPLFAGLLMGAQIFLGIEGFGAVFAFNLFLFPVGFLMGIQPA